MVRLMTIVMCFVLIVFVSSCFLFKPKEEISEPGLTKVSGKDKFIVSVKYTPSTKIECSEKGNCIKSFYAESMFINEQGDTVKSGKSLKDAQWNPLEIYINKDLESDPNITILDYYWENDSIVINLTINGKKNENISIYKEEIETKEKTIKEYKKVDSKTNKINIIESLKFGEILHIGENSTTIQINFITIGDTNWTVPSGITSAEVLTVAGGGRGGSDNSGGGGGAGGLIHNISYAVTPLEVINITVGAGGSTSNGGNSIFGTSVAIGGGEGGTNDVGTAGGSGGGGAGTNARVGGSGTAGQGFAGGQGNDPFDLGGGGGGGASEVGADVVVAEGGDGGDGLDFSIEFGTDLGDSGFYAGGGGGATTTSNGAGVGGSGGGGRGDDSSACTNGIDGTGGGGGGNVCDGGNGIIIIKYDTIVSNTTILAPINSFSVDEGDNVQFKLNITVAGTSTEIITGVTLLNITVDDTNVGALNFTSFFSRLITKATTCDASSSFCTITFTKAYADANYAIMISPGTDTDHAYSNAWNNKASGSYGITAEDDTGQAEGVNLMYTASTPYGEIEIEDGVLLKANTEASVSSGGETINFGTAFPDTNYAIVCSAASSSDSPACAIRSRTASNFIMEIEDDAGNPEITAGDWLAITQGEHNLSGNIIKAGTFTTVGGGDATITFDTAYPDANYIPLTGEQTHTNARTCICEIASISAGNFVAHCEDSADINCASITFDYITIDQGEFNATANFSKNLEYITGSGWIGNFTAPNSLIGLHDFSAFVNTTDNRESNNTAINALDYGVDGGDSCDTCNVDCSENCEVDSELDCGGGTFSISGGSTGNVIRITKNITNCSTVLATDYIGICEVVQVGTAEIC